MCLVFTILSSHPHFPSSPSHPHPHHQGTRPLPWSSSIYSTAPPHHTTPRTAFALCYHRAVSLTVNLRRIFVSSPFFCLHRPPRLFITIFYLHLLPIPPAALSLSLSLSLSVCVCVCVCVCVIATSAKYQNSTHLNSSQRIV